MSYTKQTWNNGDVITAEKLNHMEDGITEGGSSGETFVVNFTFDIDLGVATADKTTEEIITAAESMPVIGFLSVPGTPGTTLELGLINPTQFTGVYASDPYALNPMGYMMALFEEYGDDDEPTGYWVFQTYTWNLQSV